jgi:hypothetical protein
MLLVEMLFEIFKYSFFFQRETFGEGGGELKIF